MKIQNQLALDALRRLGNASEAGRKEREQIVSEVRTAYKRCDFQTSRVILRERDDLINRVKRSNPHAPFGAGNAEEVILALAWFLEETNQWDLLDKERERVRNEYPEE